MLAKGTSIIDHPLDSLDTQSCVSVCKNLGAEIDLQYEDNADSPNPFVPGKGKLTRITVNGLGIGSGGSFKPPKTMLDVGNSGTTLFLMMAVSSLGSGCFQFTGDAQIKKRSASDLLEALKSLGVTVLSENGCVPASIKGPMKGGRISLSCPTSQYLSALLLASPLTPPGTITEIDVPLLNEKPYIKMTLDYLDEQGLRYEAADDYSYFKIEGGAVYKPISGPVPGDFSSAAFPACAAAISGGSVTLLGLNPHDTQGDKKIFDILSGMGCNVEWNCLNDSNNEWEVSVSRNRPLKGMNIDLNDTPDMLPVLAAMAVYASGKTALQNVAHARIKETDRVTVMAEELRGLGAEIDEMDDGLVVHGKAGEGGPILRGGKVKGRGDHRIVMALAAAALGADGPVEIDSAECADVTYPGFLSLLGAEQKE